MPTHTKGPWRKGIDPATRHSQIYGVRDGKPVEVGRIYTHKGTPEQFANEQLALASPDLFSALADLLEHLADLGTDFQICQEILGSSFGTAAHAALESASPRTTSAAR